MARGGAEADRRSRLRRAVAVADDPRFAIEPITIETVAAIHA